MKNGNYATEVIDIKREENNWGNIMKTKEEKERLNKKYGNTTSKSSSHITELSKKVMKDTLDYLKNSNKQIILTDTDCIYYN